MELRPLESQCQVDGYPAYGLYFVYKGVSTINFEDIFGFVLAADSRRWRQVNIDT